MGSPNLLVDNAKAVAYKGGMRRREEAIRMARDGGVPTPPIMTKAEWLKREKASVSLSRSDFEYLAQVVAAGRVLLRDGRPVPSQLKAALTRLGISTQGL